MRRILIGLTLALLVLCFVRGSRGVTEDQLAVEELNRTVDEQLDRRLLAMTIGAELSALINDSSE